MNTNMNVYKTVSLPLELSGRHGDNVISVRGTEGCSFDLTKHKAGMERKWKEPLTFSVVE